MIGSPLRRPLRRPVIFVQPRPAQDELAALAGLALNGDLAAVFPQDFLAHGQAQARAAGALGDDEEGDVYFLIVAANGKGIYRFERK